VTAPAAFILEIAAELGIRIGTDGGEDLVALVPLRLSPEVKRSFERALAANKAEIISLIMQEAGDGQPRH
jgi:hypothetical protein